MEISKELLSEVLGYEALPTQVSTKELQYIDKRRKHGAFHPCCINIYELAHKCKEWALSKGYILMSKPRTSSSFATCEFCKNGKCDYEDDLWNDFRAESEQQAVFDATSWNNEGVIDWDNWEIYDE